MKNFKQLIYLILVILINCRNDESPSATNNPPNPEQGEDLSQYNSVLNKKIRRN